MKNEAAAVMPSTIAPIVKIQLDRERTIIYDWAALETLCELLPDVNPLSLKFWDELRPKHMPAVLLAGLRSEDPALTLERCRELMKGVGPGYILKQVLKAWSESRPETKEGENSADPTPETRLQ